MTHLRQAMLDELQRRNYAQTTATSYLRAVEQFAKYFKRSPDRLNLEHLRTYQAYLLRERKLEPRTVKLHVSAPLLLRQDAAPALSAGRHPLSQGAPSAPDDSDGRGGAAPD